MTVYAYLLPAHTPVKSREGGRYLYFLFGLKYYKLENLVDIFLSLGTG